MLFIYYECWSVTHIFVHGVVYSDTSGCVYLVYSSAKLIEREDKTNETFLLTSWMVFVLFKVGS